MGEKKEYECNQCGRHVEVDAAREGVPECCGALMTLVERLPACGLSSTAEHSRSFDDEGPCDDGRGGNL